MLRVDGDGKAWTVTGVEQVVDEFGQLWASAVDFGALQAGAAAVQGESSLDADLPLRGNALGFQLSHLQIKRLGALQALLEPGDAILLEAQQTLRALQLRREGGQVGTLRLLGKRRLGRDGGLQLRHFRVERGELWFELG